MLDSGKELQSLRELALNYREATSHLTLIELLESYGIKCTFRGDNNKIELKGDVLKVIFKKEHKGTLEYTMFASIALALYLLNDGTEKRDRGVWKEPYVIAPSIRVFSHTILAPLSELCKFLPTITNEVIAEKLRISVNCLEELLDYYVETGDLIKVHGKYFPIKGVQYREAIKSILPGGLKIPTNNTDSFLSQEEMDEVLVGKDDNKYLSSEQLNTFLEDLRGGAYRLDNKDTLLIDTQRESKETSNRRTRKEFMNEICKNSPEVIAYLLTLLPSSVSGVILGDLNPETQIGVILALVNNEGVSSMVEDLSREYLRETLFPLWNRGSEVLEPLATAVSILSSCSKDSQRVMLENLEISEPDICDALVKELS